MSTILPQIEHVRLTHISSLPWLGETLTLSPGIIPGACFATSSISRDAANLSTELHQSFVTHSVSKPDQKVLLEAMLLAYQFENHHHLSQTLSTLFTAVSELFNSQFSVSGEGENRTIMLSKSSVHLGIPLGLWQLESVVSAGQRYMVEFEKLGLLNSGGPLHDPSTVLSDMSEGAKASLRLRASSVDHVRKQHTFAYTFVIDNPMYSLILLYQTQRPALLRSSFEELSILLSLKDLLIPQLHDSPSLSTFILLLSDLFPGCDVPELLAHERGLRESLAVRAREDREAGESARESRATSAMMVVREDNRVPSEGLCIVIF